MVATPAAAEAVTAGWFAALVDPVAIRACLRAGSSFLSLGDLLVDLVADLR